MGLYFRNVTNSIIQVTYAYLSPGCEGGVDWSKKGWYLISPGNTAKVWTGWAGGKHFFYYAESQSTSWGGLFFTGVPWDAFDWCWNTSSTNARTVGFRRRPETGDVPSGSEDYILTLRLQ
jgi:hypothetical protein